MMKEMPKAFMCTVLGGNLGVGVWDSFLFYAFIV